MLLQGRRSRASCASLDERTLAFPSYDGNGMYLSLGNLLRNPQVGLLFIDFASPKRLRVNGIASIDEDDPLLAAYAGGAARRAGARHRRAARTAPATSTGMELVERSRFVPREDVRDAGAGLEAARLVARRAAGGDPARAEGLLPDLILTVIDMK